MIEIGQPVGSPRPTNVGLRRILPLPDLGSRVLKGIDEPVPIIEVAGERPAESRFAAIRTAHLTPFVGREHEIALLLDRWRLSVEGEGQVVVLSGEAGIGKSRIAERLRERIGTAFKR